MQNEAHKIKSGDLASLKSGGFEFVIERSDYSNSTYALYFDEGLNYHKEPADFLSSSVVRLISEYKQPSFPIKEGDVVRLRSTPSPNLTVLSIEGNDEATVLYAYQADLIKFDILIAGLELVEIVDDPNEYINQILSNPL